MRDHGISQQGVRALPATLQTIVLCVAILVIFPPIFPQSTPSQAASTADSPKFDAASVKIHKEGRAGNNFRQTGGHIAIRAFDLQQLMAIAYDLPCLSQAASTIGGMPQWGNVDTVRNVRTHAIGGEVV